MLINHSAKQKKIKIILFYFAICSLIRIFVAENKLRGNIIYEIYYKHTELKKHNLKFVYVEKTTKVWLMENIFRTHDWQDNRIT